MARRHTVLWTGPALQDLRSIKDYIAADGRPEVAKRLADRIRKRVLALEVHPQTGRPVPEFPGTGYREVIVAPFRIVYETAAGKVVVLRVWHGRRDLTQLER